MAASSVARLRGCRAAVFGGASTSGRRVAYVSRSRAVASRRTQQRQATVSVRAMVPEYPDPEFIEQTKASFPDKGIANAEEARVLFSCDGYVWLDVRSELECDEIGKVKGSVNVPWMNVARVYDAKEGKKVVKKEQNTEFISKIQKLFPNKSQAKLMIGDSDGRTYAIDALEALEEAGYSNLVGIKGGYNAWFRTWDNKLNRRRHDGYTEEYNHDGDSCGIHGTGAGFERVDKIEYWVPPKY